MVLVVKAVAVIATDRAGFGQWFESQAKPVHNDESYLTQVGVDGNKY